MWALATAVLSTVAGEDLGAAATFDASGESSFAGMVADDRIPCWILYCTVDCSDGAVISLLARLRFFQLPSFQVATSCRFYFDVRTNVKKYVYICSRGVKNYEK